MTLTIIPALTVSAAGQCFALPRVAIEEIVRVDAAAVTVARMAGTRVATIRGERLPVVGLAALLGGADRDEPLLVVLKPAGGTRFALAVAAVHDHEELVVKPAAPAIMAAGLYAGATLPDDNRPMLLLDPPGLAAAGGVIAGEIVEIDAEPAKPAEVRVASLLFVALDGVERAIRLALVERIEDVPTAAARMVQGAMRLAHDGALVPLTLDADLGARESLRVLRLSDGALRVALGIDRIVDIVDLPPATAAGVAMHDGRPIELVDAHGLFAAAGTESRVAGPLALIAEGGDDWMREVLRPMLEAAGYRVAVVGDVYAASADVVVAAAGGSPHAGAAPVVRLRTTPAGDAGSVYRYDRAGLLAALAVHAGRA